jgi:hypothetical protein
LWLQITVIFLLAPIRRNHVKTVLRIDNYFYNYAVICKPICKSNYNLEILFMLCYSCELLELFRTLAMLNSTANTKKFLNTCELLELFLQLNLLSNNRKFWSKNRQFWSKNNYNYRLRLFFVICMEFEKNNIYNISDFISV